MNDCFVLRYPLYVRDYYIILCWSNSDGNHGACICVMVVMDNERVCFFFCVSWGMNYSLGFVLILCDVWVYEEYEGWMLSYTDESCKGCFIDYLQYIMWY